MPTVSCPSCTRPLEVDDAYREWTVRCPHCQTEFVPAEVAPAPLERNRRDERAEREDRPRRRERERRDEYEDDYDRPRPRRRRRPDPEREEWEKHEAVRLAHGPGTWLEVCGWLGGLLMAGSTVLCFLVAFALMNNPNANGPNANGPNGNGPNANRPNGNGPNGNRPNANGPNANGPNNDGGEVGWVFMGLISGCATIPYTIVMVVGGRKMRSLSSSGWAMTASVVGIGSLFMMCFFCSFIPIGIGIWGVVTLNNPIVQRAFRRNSRELARGWAD